MFPDRAEQLRAVGSARRGSERFIPNRRRSRSGRRLGDFGTFGLTAGPPTRIEHEEGFRGGKASQMSETEEKHERFIVVGVDGSEPSLQALRWSARQARLTGATLRVVTTWEVSTGTGWAPLFPVDYDPEAVAKHVLDEAIADTLGDTPEIQVGRVVEEGHAAPVLLAAARGADLLVVGSHGHGAFAGMLLGSVSEHVVRHAPCAVVVVHCDKPA